MTRITPAGDFCGSCLQKEPVREYDRDGLLIRHTPPRPPIICGRTGKTLDPKRLSDLEFGGDSRLQAEACKLKLLYDVVMHGDRRPSCFHDVDPTMVHLSARQVPNPLAVAHAPRSCLYDKATAAELVLKDFVLHRGTQDDVGKTTYQPLILERGGRSRLSSSALISVHSWLQDEEKSEEPTDPEDILWSDGESDDEAETLRPAPYTFRHPDESESGRIMRSFFRRKDHIVIEYENPWKIHAYLDWCSRSGHPAPEVCTWLGDVHTWDVSFAGSCLHRTFSGNRKNKIRFEDIKSPEERIKFLKERTYIGLSLQEAIRGEGQLVPRPFALSLWGRLKAFLLGKPDPAWTKHRGGPEKYYQDPTRVHDTTRRSKRLLEVLKTVSGMFTQRYLCFPEEEWTWDRYDSYILLNLSLLIGDEFLDEDLVNDAINIRTRYTELKRVRKAFKLAAHTEVRSAQWVKDSEPRWLQQFFGPMDRILKMDRETPAAMNRYLQKVSIMSQTRGAGTPPPLVVLQSISKFLGTISQEAEDPPVTHRAAIAEALQDLLREIPKGAFTGLATKWRVTVTGSATFEDTRREGGTLKTAYDFVGPYLQRGRVPITDLESGRVLREEPVEDLDTGPLLFWAALDTVRKIPWAELRESSVTMVREPGKARTVTKGRAALKIVLDSISKVCSEPLKKVQSSKSGMSADAHAWNVAREFFSKDHHHLNFGKIKISTESIPGRPDGTTVRTTYAPVYSASTDYSEATDYFHPWIGKFIGNFWMKQCGIPKYLIWIVNQAVFQPRTIYFTGYGLMARHGEAAPTPDNPDRRSVRMVRGLLMGDPLTKPVLHLLNICVRNTARRIRQGRVLETHPETRRINRRISEHLGFSQDS